ncbi:trans-sialidase [Trypanosoma cruzi]|nr:trans-sialidase [Trypanosoma cruzi]
MEELSAVRSVLSTWSQKDIFFSSFFIPTAGLVAVLSGAASDGTWNDEYLCLNATVTANAKKVKYGFRSTRLESRAIWTVNTRGDNVRHVSLSHNFTIVASVTIEEAPSGNTPLLGAMLSGTASNHTMGLSYSHKKKWETAFEDKTTTRTSTWVPKEENQVALMLQGNRVSVDVDGESLGEEEVPLTGERPPDVLRFCFGACGRQESHVMAENVFLYSRPLNFTEMRALKDRVPVPTREAAPTPPEKIRVVDSVREHVAGDITEEEWRGTTPLEKNLHYKESLRRVWSGVSPDDRLASLNGVKLTLRDLGGNNTVRVCVSSVLLLLLGSYLGRGSLLSRRVWICDSSRRMCATLPALFCTTVFYFYFIVFLE